MSNQKVRSQRWDQIQRTQKIRRRRKIQQNPHHVKEEYIREPHQSLQEKIDEALQRMQL